MLPSFPAEAPEWAQAMQACIKTDVNDLVQLAHADMKGWFRQELQKQVLAVHKTHFPSDVQKRVRARAPKPFSAGTWKKTSSTTRAVRALASAVKTKRRTSVDSDKPRAMSTWGSGEFTKRELTPNNRQQTCESRHTEIAAKKGWQSELRRILDSYSVRIAFLVVLSINSLLIGLEVKQFSDMAFNQTLEGTMSLGYVLLEIVMCCLCTIEVGLRVAAEGTYYLACHDWAWNVFDLACLILQQIDSYDCGSQVTGWATSTSAQYGCFAFSDTSCWGI